MATRIVATLTSSDFARYRDNAQTSLMQPPKPNEKTNTKQLKIRYPKSRYSVISRTLPGHGYDKGYLSTRARDFLEVLKRMRVESGMTQAQRSAALGRPQ
ncbi:hypothetical protein [Pseudomonas amygdali]